MYEVNRYFGSVASISYLNAGEQVGEYDSQEMAIEVAKACAREAGYTYLVSCQGYEVGVAIHNGDLPAKFLMA